MDRPQKKGRPDRELGTQNHLELTLGQPDYQMEGRNMDIQKRVKILVAAACVVGVIGVGGAAFTATGITDNAPSAAFIGGTVSQSITGATLSNIGYGFADTANTEMNSVTLTFADATDGATPTVALSPTDGSVTWSCEAVGATTPDVSTCTASGTPAYQAGVTGIAVTVPTSG